MDIEVFTLCEAAADYQGRLNILGIFDTIFSPNIPAAHPHCAIAIRLRFRKAEEGKHSLVIRIVDQDGKTTIWDLSGDFTISFSENDFFGAINLVANLNDFTFNRYGEYNINLVVDSQAVSTLPFRVKQSA
jgi:hypothetical protein